MMGGVTVIGEFIVRIGSVEVGLTALPKGRG